MVATLSTAPGRSSVSSVRSSGRSAATPRRTPMQAISAIGALTTSSHSQRTWASAVPPSSGPRTNPDMPTMIITRHGAHAQRLVVEEPEDQRVGDRRHRRGGDAEPGAQGDELAGRGDEDDAQAQQAEHGEPDQQHAPASQAVGHRPGGEQQAAERQRVGAGDPLQRGRAAAEVTTDRGQRDRQQRVVDHLDEEGEAEGGQGDPGRAQRGVGARRGGGGRAWRWRSWSWPQHRRGRSHRTHTALTPRSIGFGGGCEAARHPRARAAGGAPAPPRGARRCWRGAR